MAFVDRDSPVRKCHPVNLLYVTKPIRQTGNGFLSACYAISITIWYSCACSKVSSVCLNASVWFDLFEKPIFRAWYQAESKMEKHRLEKSRNCQEKQTHVRNVKIIGYYLHSDSGSVLHFSLAVLSHMCFQEKCPVTTDEMHCVPNVRAEGEEATR